MLALLAQRRSRASARSSRRSYVPQIETLEARSLLASVTLAAVADNTLFESVSGSLSNGKGSFLFAGNTADGELRRGLIKFDVASAIPSGATINSVSLQLHMSKTAGSAESIALHRVLADWGEGTSDAAGEE